MVNDYLIDIDEFGILLDDEGGFTDMQKYMADFETTTTPDDLRVWAWCLVDIETSCVVNTGNNINSFFDYLSSENSVVYFHNLKFDGEFLLHYLLTHGYVYDTSKETGTFDCLITDDGLFYYITVYYERKNKRYLKTTFYDSLKKLPFSVSKVAKAFNLDESKLSIDYNKPRPVGYELTDEEQEYIKNDCVIVSKALKQQFDSNLVNMTVGSDALSHFKMSIGRERFAQWYPVLPLEYDSDIRYAYKGGFTYLNPKYKNKRLQGIVFDVNSLYPAMMYYKPLPYGIPIFYEGKYKTDDYYPLYIQRIRCAFQLKRNHIPTIQVRNNRSFVQTEYLKSSKDKSGKLQIIELTLTSVDFELFLQHYNVQNLEYISGWKYRQNENVFHPYIDMWSKIKTDAKQAGNNGLYTIAKLMQNSLYGKFATNPKSITKQPYLGDDNIVHYHENEIEYRDPVYTAVACFITAYARYTTITTAQKLYKRFIYADTDSIHLEGFELPDIDIHDTKLGAWKCEGEFTDSLFIRAKTYMETINGKTHVTCAGMPENVKQFVTYENFKSGQIFSGKLVPKRYAGGIVLRETEFTLKDD